MPLLTVLLLRSVGAVLVRQPNRADPELGLLHHTAIFVPAQQSDKGDTELADAELKEALPGRQRNPNGQRTDQLR